MRLRIDSRSKVPLHHQLRDGIMGMIRSGTFTPGDLMFTEVGLSREHGLSLGPVRQAVNDLVAQGLLERRRAKGVFLARTKSSGPTRRITFVTPDVAHSFYGGMIKGGEHAAREHGYSIIVANSDFDAEKEAAILTRLGGGEPQIVVLCTNGSDACRQAVERLLAQGFVVVMVDRHYPGVRSDVVENDNVAIGRDATAHLIETGHRRIAHLTLEEPEGFNAGLRRAGYEQTMREASLEPRVVIVNYPHDRWDVDVERRTLEWLEGLRDGRPTGFFVVNDPFCVGVIRALKAFGLAVPQDASVVGCSDLDFARMLSEPLTTINQDSYGMGARAVQLGIDRHEGRLAPEPVHETHPHRLIVRMTTRETKPFTGRKVGSKA